MNKQEILFQALQTLEKFMSENTAVQSGLHHLSQKVRGLSGKEFEQEMSLAVTTPAGDVPYEAYELRAKLDDMFPEIERVFQGTKEKDVISAINQIRGIIGTEDNLHFPS